MRAKFIYEDIKDILKPKGESDIKNIFREHGITDDEISIRVRKPQDEYGQVRLQRALIFSGVKWGVGLILRAQATSENGSIPFRPSTQTV